MTTPLLILSDSVAGTTGLGRIARELANRIYSDMSDVFRVGVLGVGGNYTSRVPYPNYPVQQLQNMTPLDLPQVWKDFAGTKRGILLTIWNLSWCGWLGQSERLPIGHPLRDFLVTASVKPETMTDEQWSQLNPQLQKVLGEKAQGPFKKWLYCPVDGELPNGTLGIEGEEILRGFDRVIAYTQYGSKVIENTLGLTSSQRRIHNLPHGTDTSVFYPRDRKLARETFISRVSNGEKSMPIYDDVTMVGVVATNSFRKDWGLAFETIAELVRRGKHVFLWGHTNDINGLSPQSYWNIMSLAQNMGLHNRIILTTHAMSDEDMAWCYSACDVTLGIGAGEGWGMPLTDSLACGVPVIHGNYAGGTDFVPREFLVDSPAYRLESKWMIKRPSFRASDWADKVEYALTEEAKSLAKLPEYIDWNNAWPQWKKWLLEGIQCP